MIGRRRGIEEDLRAFLFCFYLFLERPRPRLFTDRFDSILLGVGVGEVGGKGGESTHGTDFWVLTGNLDFLLQSSRERLFRGGEGS